MQSCPLITFKLHVYNYLIHPPNCICIRLSCFLKTKELITVYVPTKGNKTSHRIYSSASTMTIRSTSLLKATKCFAYLHW